MASSTEWIEPAAAHSDNTKSRPMTVFSHQRLRYTGPIKRGLAVIHHSPAAITGMSTTCALLATSVKVMKPGMPGAVHTSGDTRQPHDDSPIGPVCAVVSFERSRTGSPAQKTMAGHAGEPEREPDH